MPLQAARTELAALRAALRRGLPIDWLVCRRTYLEMLIRRTEQGAAA